MKKLFFLFLLSAFTAFSQTYVDDRQVINNGNLQTTNAQLSVASTQNNTTSTTSTQFVNQNSVFIEQVGSSNRTSVSVSSNDSQVNVFQSGTLNSVDVNLRADRIRENIVQIGNANVVQDYSLHGAQTHNATILQNGNYNTTISVGANGISENMRINQTGNGTSVYVLHF